MLAAAPERWSKIYCLSRRPPPDYFFDGVEEGRERVEHVEADFLANPEKLGEMMKSRIKRVDFVFFFSYTQPRQTGGVLSMWSDADALAKVNSDLISNFIHGLQLADLTPKRFLLQTGAKHYGFHIGPAMSPSFENDPRITLESNFYYPQVWHRSSYIRYFCSNADFTIRKMFSKSIALTLASAGTLYVRVTSSAPCATIY